MRPVDMDGVPAKGGSTQDEENEQRQERNTGISPLRFASVEMTFVWWVRRTGNGKNDGKDEMRGFFAALRMTT